MLKEIEAYIRLCMVLPSCQMKSSLRKYQKTTASSKINNEKIDDFIVFLLSNLSKNIPLLFLFGNKGRI